MAQLVQVAGALLILSAFGALQFGRMWADSRVYLILNLTGSAVLTVLAWHEEQWDSCSLSSCGQWCRLGAWFSSRAVSARPPRTEPERQISAARWAMH
jgi:hypothetical protein